jgi:uncharacterized hydrophobic protein (TIGR00271 family)
MAENFISQRLGRFEPGYLPDFESKLFFEGERRTRQVTNFTVLLLLATVIATYGVITNSTATVIGAMIIAPLMTPIMATAAATILGSPTRAFKSLQLVVLGVAAVILLSLLLTFFVPDIFVSYSSNPQITSRVSPSLLDLIIALAAGAAGAFAIGRKEIADSLAGVAIAISLVPPLCVVGISLANGHIVQAGGAFLLFLTNFFAILVAGSTVYSLMGLQKYSTSDIRGEVRQKAIRYILAGTLVITVLLVVTSFNAFQTTNNQYIASSTVTEWLGTAPFQVSGVTTNGVDVSVTLVGNGDIPPVADLEARLKQTFGHPVIISLHVIPQTSVVYPQPAT